MTKKPWWDGYSGDVLETIAEEYWSKYAILMRALENSSIPTGSPQYWAVEKKSVVLLTEWVAICKKLNKVIR